MCASIHVLGVRVIELFLLVSKGLILTHVHRLATLRHLAVLLLVTRKLVWVDHAEHLGEALTDAGDSLSGVAEGQLVPGHEFDLLSVHVYQALLAGGARHTTKRLLAEHGIFLIVTLSIEFLHEEVQVFNLLLMHLESLTSIALVSELLLQSFDNVTETVLQGFVESGEISLLIKIVLELLDPFGKLISQVC